MKPHLTDPSILKPSDVEAHAVLDDDGNPWHPLDPEPTDAWSSALRKQLDAATHALSTYPVLTMGLALGAGYLVGRLLAARAGS
jgi:hypothetical protein